MNTYFFTGKGDKGDAHFGTKKLPKEHPLFDVLGGLDEANSFLGLCSVEARRLAFPTGGSLFSFFDEIRKLQELLFIFQAHVAACGFDYESTIQVREEHVLALEKAILSIDAELPAIRTFVIPGGSELATRLDVARAIVRRMERDLIRFNNVSALPPLLVQCANRLSSVLFALARYANFILKVPEDKPRY